MEPGQPASSLSILSHVIAADFPLEDSSVATILEELLDASILLLDADMGNVQLYDVAQDCLTIAAQRGFDQHFLDRFASFTPGGTACGQAVRNRKRIVFEDAVSSTEDPADREAVQRAGYVSVQLTPLLSRNGTLLGVVSTHYRQPRLPSTQQLATFDLYVEQAANYIESLRRIQITEAEVASRDEFVDAVSHELRTPLTIILGNSSLISKFAAGKLQGLDTDFDLQMAGDDLLRQSHRLQRTIDNLLTLARFDHRQPSDLAPVMLWPIVQHAIAACQSGEPDRSFDLRGDGEHSRVMANEAALEVILSNFLSNAIKYSPAGSRIEVSCSVETARAIVSVIDHGGGIHDADVDHLFEPFFRSGDGSQRKSGIGLGLYISQRLAEAMGCLIEARNTRDGGAAFSLSLQLCA